MAISVGDPVLASDFDMQPWTPTLTNMTQGNGTIIARYQQIDTGVWWKFRFTLGSTSSMGTNPQITLPVVPSGITEAEWMGSVSVRDLATASFYGPIRYVSGSTIELKYWTVSGANLSPSNITSTTPMTWGTGDILVAQGMYEAA